MMRYRQTALTSRFTAEEKRRIFWTSFLPFSDLSRPYPQSEMVTELIKQINTLKSKSPVARGEKAESRRQEGPRQVEGSNPSTKVDLASFSGDLASATSV